MAGRRIPSLLCTSLSLPGVGEDRPAPPGGRGTGLVAWAAGEGSCLPAALRVGGSPLSPRPRRGPAAQRPRAVVGQPIRSRQAGLVASRPPVRRSPFGGSAARRALAGVCPAQGAGPLGGAGVHCPESAPFSGRTGLREAGWAVREEIPQLGTGAPGLTPGLTAGRRLFPPPGPVLSTA